MEGSFGVNKGSGINTQHRDVGRFLTGSLDIVATIP